MCSALIRGYNNQGFEAWTIPCLYVAEGKHLRIFAIKADNERNTDSSAEDVAIQEFQGRLRYGDGAEPTTRGPRKTAKSYF